MEGEDHAGGERLGRWRLAVLDDVEAVPSAEIREVLGIGKSNVARLRRSLIEALAMEDRDAYRQTAEQARHQAWVLGRRLARGDVIEEPKESGAPILRVPEVSMRDALARTEADLFEGKSTSGHLAKPRSLTEVTLLPEPGWMRVVEYCGNPSEEPITVDGLVLPCPAVLEDIDGLRALIHSGDIPIRVWALNALPAGVAYLIEGSDPVVRGELVETNQAPARSAPRAATPPVDASRKLPFDGIRVLDLTHFWAGPYATMLLGALGADVIKIESIQRPDAYRFTNIGSSGQRWYEWGSLWNDSNCDKRDLTLDLSSPLGKELFERLARDADLVISNFSNRVMPNLGLTPERLHEINPRIIYATLPGYGIGGPWDDYVGYGVAFEQLAAASRFEPRSHFGTAGGAAK